MSRYSLRVLARIYRIRQELGKFFSVGLASYVVGVGGFNLLVHTSFAPFKSRPITASFVSGVASILTAYLGNRHWTWRDRKKSGVTREILLFFTINGLGLALVMFCLGISRYILNFDSVLADNISGNIVGVGLGTILRFWSYRTIVFKK